MKDSMNALKPKAVIWAGIVAILMWNGNAEPLTIVAICLVTYLISSALYSRKEK